MRSRLVFTPHPLVVLDALEGDDLGAEAPLVDGSGGAAVALEGERLHVPAADVPALGDESAPRNWFTSSSP